MSTDKIQAYSKSDQDTKTVKKKKQQKPHKANLRVHHL